MALVEAFLKQYATEKEVSRYLSATEIARAVGRVLVLDFPVKEFDTFISRVVTLIWISGYRKPSLIVANEGAAVFAALNAAGYTAQDIVNLRVDGRLDVLDLIQGKKKHIPNIINPRKKGAEHKGLRFRDCINTLLVEKVRKDVVDGGDAPVTFDELLQFNPGCPISFTCYDDSTKGVAELSAVTCPSMSVADAVLATCAVKPFIRRVSFKDDEGAEHLFYSCSSIQTLPLGLAQTIFKKSKMAGRFAASLSAFGFVGKDLAEEPVIGKLEEDGSTPVDFSKFLDAPRQKAAQPPEYGKSVILIGVLSNKSKSA